MYDVEFEFMAHVVLPGTRQDDRSLFKFPILSDEACTLVVEVTGRSRKPVKLMLLAVKKKKLDSFHNY